MRAPSSVRIVLLALGLAAACESPVAPTLLVFADRPITVPATSRGWSSLSVGAAHTCALRVDGSAFCWGSNGSGQLGVGTSRGRCGRRALACEGGPRAVATSLRFIQISAGQRHTCAVSTDRALFCWGESINFQTGIEREVFVTTPMPVLPTLQFVDVSAGATHTCAVRTNGVVYCWGDGSLGALGRGDTVSSVIPTPVAGSQRYVIVRAGRTRSCAIAVDGGVWCWGAEWEGADGNFDYFHARLTPHRINGMPPARDVTVSSTSICAVSLEGVSYCWEANGFAQLGNGNLEGTAIPVTVQTTDRFTSISAGIIQGCATTVDFRALCWGNNSFGQLGVPRPGERCGGAALECSRVPIGVFGQLHFTSVVTGLGNHTCGITTDSALLCWGLGSDGQLGDGFTRDRQSLPVGVLGPVL